MARFVRLVVVNVNEFVLSELHAPPGRVLEIGCGSGDLARALVGAGYDVLAVDPDAPEGPPFRRTTIEALDEPGSFDAAVASRSLHHVDDLTVALDNVARLLRPEGKVVVDDFAWERLDAPSAAAAGIDLVEWRTEHDHLHPARAMLRALDERFADARIAWEPYLYRESRQVFDEAGERELIAAGKLAAIGFRFVGTRYDPD